MLRLHLLRHAQPLTFGPFSSDIERPLDEHGRQQCHTLQKKLNLDWSRMTIWCSTAIRTKETAKNIFNASILSEVVLKEELYHASMKTLLQLITTYHGTDELLIIGHNNGLSELFNYLSDNLTMMQTGHFVCLEFSFDHWNEVSHSTATVVREVVP